MTVIMIEITIMIPNDQIYVCYKDYHDSDDNDHDHDHDSKQPESVCVRNDQKFKGTNN